MAIVSKPLDLILENNFRNSRIRGSERNRGRNQLLHGGNSQLLLPKTQS